MRPVLGYKTLYSQRITGLKKNIPACPLQYEAHNISISPCKCYRKIEICFGKNRKHCEKGENAGYQHFSLLLQWFQKASFSRSLKVGIVR